MILIHVSVQAKEETADTFEKNLRQLVDDARKRTGCIEYEWYRTADLPRGYVIHGEFDSKDNFEEYLNSAVVERIGNDLIPLLETPPQFKHFEATLFESG